MTHIILVIFWGVTQVTFSCKMHHFGDIATLVFKPNSGWLSKMPIQEAHISLKIKSYYEILVTGTIDFRSIQNLIDYKIREDNFSESFM